MFGFAIVYALSFLFSCIGLTEEINYGDEECFICKMLIVDKRHGAIVSTNKEKKYKFDSIECMIDFTINFKKNGIKRISVIDYNNPGNLIDATSAFFLKSTNIPSPMGAFLSAIKEKKIADDMLAIKGGEIFTWNNLLEQYNSTYPIE